MSVEPAPGRLLLVPNTLDHGAPCGAIDDVLPRGVLVAAASLRHWAAEDARSARAFLKRVADVVALAAPLQSLSIVELPRPRKGASQGLDERSWQPLLAPALAGHDLGLLSEAGLPAVADPGSGLVRAAHRAGVPVVALPGPSSPMLALAASGLNGQNFAFVGYLPHDAGARTERLRQLEARSRNELQTQLFIETPYRNQALTDALLAQLAPTTRLAIACGLTLEQGWTACRTVAEWRAAPPVFPPRLPAVFALLAA